VFRRRIRFKAAAGVDRQGVELVIAVRRRPVG